MILICHSEWKIFKSMAVSEASSFDIHTMEAKSLMESIVANESLFPNLSRIALAALLINLILASTADC